VNERASQARRTELAGALTNRAATEHAARLEGEIERIRERLGNVVPVQSVNPQATALIELFRLDTAAATAISERDGSQTTRSAGAGEHLLQERDLRAISQSSIGVKE
jgi:hypothetical protein